MSVCCANKAAIFADPCQALADGILDPENYSSHGLSREGYYLLVAQCGANASLEEIANDLDTVITLLTQIEANTDDIESLLADIILELQDVNTNLGDVITELQAILVAVQNIDDNTDGIEAQLTSIIALLTSIDGNTDGLEACCAAGNAILTDIELNQEDDDIFGTHTIATGTQAAPPAAGPYFSWTVVRTDTLGVAATLTADGLPLYSQGDATGETAQPQHQVPAPVIVPAGGALYAWRTVS